MIRAHKIKLDPNREQTLHFARACGIARHAYNWALAEWKIRYESGQKTSGYDLCRQYNAIKKVEFPWLAESGVASHVSKHAIMNAETAFKNFFRRIKQKSQKPGYPRFKKKGVHDSFRADNGPAKQGADAVQINGTTIKLPMIGVIRMRESVRFAGQIKSAVVSRMADGWYVALTVETEDRLTATTDNGTVGVDLGVKTLAVLSTGEIVDGPKAHTAQLNRLKRLSRSLSRKTKGSQNRDKAKKKLAKLHQKIANVRNNAAHNLSKKLTTEFNTIAMEDLNVSGMAKNKCLARSIMDGGFFEIRRQVEYKAQMTGSQLIMVDRWYPSSKTCSNCGKLHDMPLSVRVFSCDCGYTADRDMNAAINLAKYAAGSAVSACGEDGSGGVSAP